MRAKVSFLQDSAISALLWSVLAHVGVTRVQASNLISMIRLLLSEFSHSHNGSSRTTHLTVHDYI